MDELEGIVQELLDEGRDDAFINEVVSMYEQQNSQPTETTGEVVEGNEEAQTDEEFETERVAKEEGYRAAHAALPGAAAVVSLLPDFLLEPYAAFESTLLGFGSGLADAAVQQYARVDDTKYDYSEDGKLVESEDGETIEQILENTKGTERVELWEQYNNAGDTIRDAIEGSQFAEQRGSGSISTELAEGNIANAAQLTVNQTASGLASLVPFLVPGGMVVGPAVLGGSVVGSSFEEDLEKQGDAAINDIYNASYAKGGVELASEFVTAGIIGKAKKLAAGGTAAKAVKELGRKAWKGVLGDAASEGLSEGAADFGSRLVDKAVFGDDIEWREAATGFIDSAIVGAIVGGKVSGFGQIANPEAVAAQKKQLEEVVAATLATDESNAEVHDATQKVLDATVVESQTTGDNFLDRARNKAAKKEIKENVDKIRDIREKQIKALKSSTPAQMKELAAARDSFNNLTTLVKNAKEGGNKQAEKTFQDQLDQVTKEYDNLYEQAYFRDDLNGHLEFQEKKLDSAIADSDATIEQIQLSDNGLTKANKQTLKKARERKKENQTIKKALIKTRENLIPRSPGAVSSNAKQAGIDAEFSAKKRGTDKTNQKYKAQQAKNESIIENITDPNSSYATKQRAESEFLKENQAKVTDIRKRFKSANPNLEALTDGDINSVIETELLRRANNFDKSKGHLGQHLTNKLYNKVANTILNKDKKTRDKKRLADNLTLEQKEEVDYIKSLGLDPDQEANEIANITKQFAPRFTSLEQGGYEGDPIQVALDEDLTDEIFTEDDVDTETDTAYVPETASDAARASIAKAYALSDSDIQLIKKEITDGLSTGAVVLPTGKDQRALMTGLRKKAAKNINKKIDNVIGKNSKTAAGLKAASDKILGNTEQIFSLLPKGAKDQRRFNGIFTNGNPDIDTWNEYFFAPGRQGYTHRKRLKEALAENALAQYVDEVVKEYPDFSEDWFADKPIRSEKAAVIEIISRQFPDVKIHNTIKAIKDRLRAVGIDPARYTQVNGMLSGNAVFLNPDSSSTETLIHEFGHIWVKDLRRSNPALYNRGVKLMSESAWYQRILEASRDPKSLYYNYSSQKIMEEAMATAIGQRGEGLFKYKTQSGLLSKWKEFMTEFKAVIAKQLGINRDQNLETLDKSDFIDIAVTDILSGKKELTEKERMIADGFEFGALPVAAQVLRYKIKVKDTNLLPERKQLAKEGWSQTKIQDFIDKQNQPNTPAGQRASTNAIYDKVLQTKNIKIPNDPAFRASINFVLGFSPQFQGRALRTLGVRPRINSTDYSARTGLNNIAKWDALAKLNPQIPSLQTELDSLRAQGLQTVGKAQFNSLFNKVLEYQNGKTDFTMENTSDFLVELGQNLASIADPQVRSDIRQVLGDSQSGFRADAEQVGYQKTDGPVIDEHVMPVKHFLDKLTKYPDEALETIKGYVRIDLSKADNDSIPKSLKSNMPGNTPANLETIAALEKAGMPGSLVRYFNNEFSLDPSTLVVNNKNLAKAVPHLVGLYEAYVAKQPADIEFSERSQKVNKPGRTQLENEVTDLLKLQGLAFKGTGPYKRNRITSDTKAQLDVIHEAFTNATIPFSNNELLQIKEDINELIRTGKDERKGLDKDAQQNRKETTEKVDDILRDEREEIPEEITEQYLTQQNKRRNNFLRDIRKGKFASALSRIIAPHWNNDFYGLLYDLLPAGKNRSKAKNYFKKKLTEPLEKAELEHLTRKNGAIARYDTYADAVGKKNLRSQSGLDINGQPLTNSQVVKIYNYMKDPTLYTQLKKGGVDAVKMQEIYDYMEKDVSGLKIFSDNIADLYASFATDLNVKLNQHGYSPVGGQLIDKSTLNPDERKIADQMLGGRATRGKYTPFSAEGEQTLVTPEDIEKANYNIASVMADNLRQRTGGGEFKLGETDVLSDLHNYLEGPVRTLSFLDFASEASAVFNPKTVKLMRAANGDGWVDSMKDSLRRTVTGKTETARRTPASKAFTTWMNYTIGGVMFFNVRSAALQLLSTMNWFVDGGSQTLRGITPSPLRSKVKDKIKNSAWAKQRGKGQTDVVLADVLDKYEGRSLEKVMQYVIRQGYMLTKAGDKTAITLGGIPWATGRAKELIAEGLTEDQAVEQAYVEFVSKAEETQQSARQSRLGKEQTTAFGKIFLAFQNTPMQYARKVARGLQDVTSPGSTGKEKRSAATNIGYYGVASPLIFNGLQKAIWNAFDSDEEEEDKFEIITWLTSFIHTNLSGAGVTGVLGSTVLEVLEKLYKDSSLERDTKASDIERILVNSSPAIGTKLRQARKVVQGSYPNSDLSNTIGDEEYKQLTQGLATGDLAGFPASRFLYVYEQFRDAWEISVDYPMEAALRALGWSNYSLFGKENSPFNRKGATGQAFGDGTIEVDPNLSPEERHKTIQHEKQHVKDMKENGLGYDDKNVYWKGSAFKRKDGMINYNGKWLKEGAKDFPWEAHAYEAETPLARSGDKKKEDEKYIRNPEHIEQVNKSRERFEQHYSDPVTEELYRQNTGFNDLPSKVDNALNTRIQTGFVPQGAKATYDPAIGDYKGAITVEDYRDPAVIDHELSHAAGFDELLGKEAQKILGKPKSGDKYLSKPSEVYGNLHEFRTRLDLRGFERNLTPKRVEELIKFNELEDDPDINQMIDEFGLDNLSEALNKVASNKEKPTLEGLYG